MISGIVIDKFGSMREEIEKRRDQFNSSCFICGKERGRLETETKKGFQFHTDKEHNLWNYISFIGYLFTKPECELDSDELTIFEEINKNSISWFPSQIEVFAIEEALTLTYLLLSLIHISEPTRPLYISYAVFCLKKKKKKI
eukprot:TRINITY_DN11738_c0_g1_i3.p2 TRINITY_DN11738_c0_g1~~TRINITY_DN11738_c0_g1_i3.p2  ORF type:complete len:142 (+),score=27.29 TRINITY_DN11738_c0_g1_i3:397-822(+)